MPAANGAVTGMTHRARSIILPSILLLGSFTAIEAWFCGIDFYDRHFFDSGWYVVIHNGARVILTAILFWLIYAPGYAVLAMIRSPGRPPTASIAERLLLGFSIGIGVWHVGMLLLGIAGLYDRPLIIAIAVLVLLASTRHFASIVTDIRHGLTTTWRHARRKERITGTLGAFAVTTVIAWILLVRALYPGGSGDYYTHYFPYYSAVLQHHGIAPNDVWYHYFYSKGDGLFFLAMLLGDPLESVLPTFCCVTMAALALLTFGRRVAPGSLWPLCVTLIYLLYCLVGFGEIGSGEFQKDHELTSALMLLTMWAYCTHQLTRDRAFLVAAIACAITGTIVAQPVGILLGAGMAALAVDALVGRRWQQLRDSIMVGACLGMSILAMLILSYATVGLATDQPLDLALRFADTHRLDQQGLLPILAVTAWTRHNYAAVAPPFGPRSVIELGIFLRAFLVWVLFSVLLLWTFQRHLVGWLRARARGNRTEAAPSVASADGSGRVWRDLVIVIGALAGISFFAGHVQDISYGRFSTFFVPLVMLLGGTWSGAELAMARTGHYAWFVRVALPLLILAGTLASWWDISHWPKRVTAATSESLRFLEGRYSLADAYAHQQGGWSFGGVNPETLAAVQHAPPDATIWSTNVVSAVCMAPACHLESVISFKMSGQLDDILTGPPALAKQLLQQANLNYFLISTQWPLLDLLPYSHLFDPGTIGQYLGIKWTDGTTYLLTWNGADTTPLGASFLAAYRRMLDVPEHPWFKFRDLLPQLNAAVAMLRQKQFGQPPAWPWDLEPPPQIIVLSATYGGNCPSLWSMVRSGGTAPSGDERSYVQEACRAGQTCKIRVDVIRMSDPAQGCAKDFSVSYRCRSDGRTTTVTLPKEANGKTVILDCSDAR